MTSRRLDNNLDGWGRIPISQRAMIEGDPYSTFNQLENATLADNNTVASFAFPSVGRALWVDSIDVSSNKAVVLQLQIGSSVESGLNHVRRIALPAGGAVSLPIRSLYRPLHQSAGTNALGSVVVRKALDTTAGAYVYASIAGWQLYDDLNYGADKVILTMADSIWNDKVGNTAKTTSMLWQTRGYFKTKGQNVRVINKAMSGSSSTDHEFRRKQGGYDYPQVDLLIYALGTNDAGLGISASTSAANLSAMIAHKQKFYPNAKMLVVGATPRENNTYETALVAIRSAQQAAVTSAADPKVLWVSLASAFDRTNTANFASADPAGDHVHPNDTGHAAGYAVLSAFFDANLPTI